MGWLGDGFHRFARPEWRWGCHRGTNCLTPALRGNILLTKLILQTSTVFDWSTRVTDRQTDGQAIAYSTLITLIEYEYRVSSSCCTHGTTAAFSERMLLSPSTSLRWRVFRTQPMVSAWTSVHWTSVRPSWMIVRAIRRWMPWCSRNVPQHGRSSACDTLVDTYLAQQTQCHRPVIHLLTHT